MNEDLKNYIRQELDGSDARLVFPDTTDEAALLEQAEQAHVLVGWKPSDTLLDRAANLELFINPGAGVQHLIAPMRKLNESRKVILVNGHGNAFFTAEHIIAMLLAVTNRLLPHHLLMREGKWRLGDDLARSVSLGKRTIGLLGYGHVNRQVHAFLRPFTDQIRICRRHPQERHEFGPEHLHEFLGGIDTLVITLPSTSGTHGLISARELELLGEDGIIINAGRGDVVDEEALYHALKDRTISQAAIDVWYEYHPEEDSAGRRYPYTCPFHELDNILLSPHRAASPFNDLERWGDVIENIRRHSSGRRDLLNRVDLDLGY